MRLIRHLMQCGSHFPHFVHFALFALHLLPASHQNLHRSNIRWQLNEVVRLVVAVRQFNGFEHAHLYFALLSAACWLLAAAWSVLNMIVDGVWRWLTVLRMEYVNWYTIYVCKVYMFLKWCKHMQMNGFF